MKRCPTCKRTFEDTLTYCLIDGSILDAPFDPQATLIIPEPRQTEPPPTEILPVEETREEIPPTVASPEPQRKLEESVPTIAAPAPVLESEGVKASSALPSQQSNRLLLIMVALGGLLLTGLIMFLSYNRSTSTHENDNRTNIVTTNTSNPNSSTTVTNNMQVSSTATPSPVPSLTPVSNLEGTVWDVAMTQKSNGVTYKETFEFKPNGEMTEIDSLTPDIVDKGVWTQQGNKVSIKHGDKITGDRWSIEGTINGNEMSGYYNFIDLAKPTKNPFTARRIK